MKTNFSESSNIGIALFIACVIPCLFLAGFEIVFAVLYPTPTHWYSEFNRALAIKDTMPDEFSKITEPIRKEVKQREIYTWKFIFYGGFFLVLALLVIACFIPYVFVQSGLVMAAIFLEHYVTIFYESITYRSYYSNVGIFLFLLPLFMILNKRSLFSAYFKTVLALLLAFCLWILVYLGYFKLAYLGNGAFYSIFFIKHDQKTARLLRPGMNGHPTGRASEKMLPFLSAKA